MEKINLAYRRKDDLLDGVMLVKTVAARKSSNGGLYLDLTVMDATGEMNAKAWNWQDGAALPPCLDSAEKTADFYEYLLSRDVSQQDADGIFFENARAFLRKNLG